MTQNVETKSVFMPFFFKNNNGFFFFEENAHSDWEFGNTELQTIKMLTFNFSKNYKNVFKVHGNILS